MSPWVIVTDSAAGTGAVGEAFGRLAQSGDVLLLSGDLGAGKTQLVKGLARGLGVTGPVTSPTFNILLVHRGRLTLNHIDLYRLERAGQLEDIDYFGTLESGGVSAVEWGDRFVEAAPGEYVGVSLHIVSDDERHIALEPVGERAWELARAVARVCESASGVHVTREAE